MKIRKGNWKIDSSTLVRFEWRASFPRLVLHEKYHGIVKWALRGLTAIGIATSLISLPTQYGFMLSVFLFLLQLFFEKIILEYTTLIAQPLPEFEVEGYQWVTNGYLFPAPAYKDSNSLLIHFGMTYKDRSYAEKFFIYLASWNEGNYDDVENNICLSFVLEEDNSYTTYIYANPRRKRLDEMFEAYHKEVRYDKYGKRQQQLVMQMIYWKNLPFREGALFPKFLSEQRPDRKFFFVPFYLDEETPGPLEELKIAKYSYRIRRRHELIEGEAEYHHR